MTKEEALKLAYQGLKNIAENAISPYEDAWCGAEAEEVLPAIEAALAQPAQEPVAWGVFEGNLHDMFFTQAEAQKMAELKGSHAEVRPLYTTPPQRPWVGLTDDEVYKIAFVLEGEHWRKIADAIEAKLKDKNT